MQRRLHGMLALLALSATVSCHRAPSSATRGEPEAFLFSYFTRNGDDGLHLAYSADGTTWTALNGGRSMLTPSVMGSGVGWQQWDTRAALMRDPSIRRGPDGTFHMVWTIAWSDRGIGVAHSRDLIHWSEQQRVPVMDHEPTALNAWAPDMYYDDATREFVIVWATSIPGRFPATDSLAQRTNRGRADHRPYYVTTRDFVTYSRAQLLYDGGFAAIDGTITRQGKRYVLVMKDETFFPERRNLRVAFADKAIGPYGPAAPTFTDLHTEGPSILQTGGWWYVYYDEYTRGHYGAVRTKDFVRFEPYRDSLITPRGIRHGSAFLAPTSVLRGLMALDSTRD
jgi:hypothetical protein